MKHVLILVITLVFCFSTLITFAGERTQIKIISHDSSASNHQLEIEIFGAEDRTEILIFIETKGSSRFVMISDKQGAPYTADRIGENLWKANFFVSQPPSAIYAIAARRAEFSNWGKERDLSALKRLGIENMGSINGVLSLLNEFGWMPTGYTFTGTSNLRNKGDSSSPNQSNTSNICQTNYGSCPLIEYASYGERCFCNTPDGPVSGIIAQP